MKYPDFEKHSDDLIEKHKGNKYWNHTFVSESFAKKLVDFGLWEGEKYRTIITKNKWKTK